jgi:hypothetical protein
MGLMINYEKTKYVETGKSTKEKYEYILFFFLISFTSQGGF